MPVARLNVIAGHPRDDLKAALVGAAEVMSRVLGAPVERLQVWLNEVDADFWLVAGMPASHARETMQAADIPAALVDVSLLKGRPVAQHQALIAELTALLSEKLAIARPRIRVLVTELSPESWGIGGTPASEVRAAEIRARAAESGN
ncbi:MAG: tautomerase family protein [Hyphomicrobiales bacterium]